MPEQLHVSVERCRADPVVPREEPRFQLLNVALAYRRKRRVAYDLDNLDEPLLVPVDRLLVGLCPEVCLDVFGEQNRAAWRVSKSEVAGQDLLLDLLEPAREKRLLPAPELQRLIVNLPVDLLAVVVSRASKIESHLK